jgi:3-deoxy-manno-octulosonate cytidylyltransferase (CMP-KDO synthetase)
MNIIGIIPARYASTRFPGKPLTMINGKLMIQRVYEQATMCKQLSKVVVATDDERIYKAVKEFNGEVVMTASHHQSGTDRCAEVIEGVVGSGFEIAINIQGDEPYIQPNQIEKVISCFKNSETEIATLIKKIENKNDLQNSNVVKVVTTVDKKALYFSRAALPYQRGVEMENWLEKNTYFKHIGIYAYRTNILKSITKLTPSSFELAESLEQLRWLQNGYTITVEETNIETIAIDTPEDLEKL